MSSLYPLRVVMTFYRHYREGFLPKAGGIADQPAFLLACLETCATAVNEHEQLEREQREATSHSSNKGPKVVGRLSEEDAKDPNWQHKIRPAKQG